MVAELWNIVQSTVTGFLTTLVSAFNGVTELFYADEQFTVIGTLLLIALGMGIVYFAFRFIRNLIG